MLQEHFMTIKQKCVVIAAMSDLSADREVQQRLLISLGDMFRSTQICWNYLFSLHLHSL